MASPNATRFGFVADQSTHYDKNLNTGLILIGRAFAQALVSDNGYSKEDVKQFLWENSKKPYDEITIYGHDRFLSRGTADAAWHQGDEVVHCPLPEQVKILVAGGDQGGHAYWMGPMVWGANISCEIELPAKWDDPLFQAEIDLGPLPTAH